MKNFYLAKEDNVDLHLFRQEFITKLHLLLWIEELGFNAYMIKRNKANVDGWGCGSSGMLVTSFVQIP